MAKSNYLSGILFLAALCLCGYAGSYYLVVSCLLPVVSESLVQKELGSPNWKQEIVIWEGESLKQKRYQEGGSLKLKAKSLKQNEVKFGAGFPSEPIAKSLKQKKYQVSGIRYEDKISLEAKSAFPTTNNQQLTTKKIYDSQIGIREKGINSGSQVEEYLHYVNLGRGQPWCAAFICWVYGKAGIGNPRSGWSPDLFREKNVIWSRAESVNLKGKSFEPSALSLISGQDFHMKKLTNRSQQPTTPGTGDIFGIYFPEKKRIAHAGFIDQWGETWLITVEGNTNISGSRDGDGVYRKRRLVRSVYRVARWEEGL